MPLYYFTILVLDIGFEPTPETFASPDYKSGAFSLSANPALCGRNDRIRTCDPLVPNQLRYQTALHSDLLFLVGATGFEPATPPPQTECSDQTELHTEIIIILVGIVGFEPTTLCSQSRCATKLRYIPIYYFWSVQQDSNLRPLRP